MAIDFNNAPEQKELAEGPIPPKSIVWVKMEIRPASGTKLKSDLHPLLCKSDKENHYLDCEFVTISGTYEGCKIWEIFIVHGSEKATQISNAFIRAALEAARGINPKDTSAGAVAARQIQDWTDLNNLEFPVKVGIKKPKQNDKYINNSIMRAITPDKKEWPEIQGGGEIITNNPIPELPQQTAGGPQGQPSWAGGNASAPSQEQGPAPNDKDVPHWAK